MPTEFQARIERITFTNEENGYTPAKLKVYGRRNLVTIVGNLVVPLPGTVPPETVPMMSARISTRTIKLQPPDFFSPVNVLSRIVAALASSSLNRAFKG